MVTLGFMVLEASRHARYAISSKEVPRMNHTREKFDYFPWLVGFVIALLIAMPIFLMDSWHIFFR